MSSPSLPIATALVWALFISHLNRRDNLSSGVLTDQSPADSYPLSLSIILAAGMVFLKGKSDHVPSGLKPFDKSPFFQGDMHTPAWHWRLLGLISKHSSNLFSCYVTWDPPPPPPQLFSPTSLLCPHYLFFLDSPSCYIPQVSHTVL